MLATWIWDKHLGLFQHLKFNILLLCEICNIRDPETSSTTVPNKIYLKESWIASLSLAMTILKIRNVIAKECICTTVAIHFCYLILFYFVVLLYILITGFIRNSSGIKFRMTMTHFYETQLIYIIILPFS